MLRDVQCLYCKHYKGHYCDAFPFLEKEVTMFSCSIPEDIRSGKYDHRKPYPGDNGIQFEPIDE